MDIFSNLKRNLAIILGIAFVAVTVPYMCSNMNKVEVAHTHSSHTVDASQHLSPIECCTNGEHSSMHILSAAVSDFRLPVPLNNFGFVILISVLSLFFAKVYFTPNQNFSFLIGGIRLLRPPLLC